MLMKQICIQANMLMLLMQNIELFGLFTKLLNYLVDLFNINDIICDRLIIFNFSALVQYILKHNTILYKNIISIYLLGYNLNPKYNCTH